MHAFPHVSLILVSHTPSVKDVASEKTLCLAHAQHDTGTVGAAQKLNGINHWLLYTTIYAAFLGTLHSIIHMPQISHIHDQLAHVPLRRSTK